MKKTDTQATYVGKILKTDESNFAHEEMKVNAKLLPPFTTFCEIYQNITGEALTEEKWANILVYRLRDEHTAFMEKEGASVKGFPDLLRNMVLPTIDAKFKPLQDALERVFTALLTINTEIGRGIMPGPEVTLDLFTIVDGKPQYNKAKAIKWHQLIIETEAQAEAYRLILSLQETYTQLISHMSAHGLHPQWRILSSQGYIWEEKQQMHFKPDIITLVKDKPAL